MVGGGSATKHAATLSDAIERRRSDHRTNRIPTRWAAADPGLGEVADGERVVQHVAHRPWASRSPAAEVGVPSSGSTRGMARGSVLLSALCRQYHLTLVSGGVRQPWARTLGLPWAQGRLCRIGFIGWFQGPGVCSTISS
jgi:hypothetical protein